MLCAYESVRAVLRASAALQKTARSPYENAHGHRNGSTLHGRCHGVLDLRSLGNPLNETHTHQQGVHRDVRTAPVTERQDHLHPRTSVARMCPGAARTAEYDYAPRAVGATSLRA